MVIEEVFQELLLFYLVVALPYKTLRAASFVVTKNRSLDYLLKDKLVFSVPYFMINLTQTKSWKKSVEHLVTPCQQHYSKITLSPFLKSVQNVKKARMHT